MPLQSYHRRICENLHPEKSIDSASGTNLETWAYEAWKATVLTGVSIYILRFESFCFIAVREALRLYTYQTQIQKFTSKNGNCKEIVGEVLKSMSNLHFETDGGENSESKDDLLDTDSEPFDTHNEENIVNTRRRRKRVRFWFSSENEFQERE
ncbi:hypothetical protein TNCV_590501 [Trichonephila clavipes]|nr:hypothetical protein TNCV_590501 [Trichonephila clavipes]